VAELGNGMPRIETVVFDVSGVLLNDLYAVWRADSEAYEICGMGKIESIESFKETFKLPIIEYHRSMGVPDIVMPKIEATFRRVYPKYISYIEIFPEVKAVLEKLRRENVRLAIASNIPSDFLSKHLQSFGIIGYFDVMTGQDDCKEQKPSPQPILVTLEKLKVEPKRSAYVGDMEEDIVAAKKASVCTIGICREEGYHPCWKLKRQNPDFLIRDLNQLSTIVRRCNRLADSH
jgi:HAD superfamily hydrolase (TIGR01549 family)